MPNHFHMVLPSDSDELDARDFAVVNGLMGTLCAKVGATGLWQAKLEPESIPDKTYLRRVLRYVALNPCRKSLCNDPLKWPWSTYRDLFGACVDQWVSPEGLAGILGESETGFTSRFHKYVSSDPSVSITGTRTPVASKPRIYPEHGIMEILDAATFALRSPFSSVRHRGRLRELFVHFAYQQGWKNPTVLAQLCNVSPRAINQIISKETPDGLGAAEMCLGDRRLRILPSYLSRLGEFSLKRKNLAYGVGPSDRIFRFKEKSEDDANSAAEIEIVRRGATISE